MVKIYSVYVLKRVARAKKYPIYPLSKGFNQTEGPLYKRTIFLICSGVEVDNRDMGVCRRVWQGTPEGHRSHNE